MISLQISKLPKRRQAEGKKRKKGKGGGGVKKETAEKTELLLRARLSTWNTGSGGGGVGGGGLPQLLRFSLVWGVLLFAHPLFALPSETCWELRAQRPAAWAGGVSLERRRSPGCSPQGQSRCVGKTAHWKAQATWLSV